MAVSHKYPTAMFNRQGSRLHSTASACYALSLLQKSPCARERAQAFSWLNTDEVMRMCISATDVRAEEVGVFFGLLCGQCQRTVEQDGRELFDLSPEEWGFCKGCLEAIRKEIETREAEE